MLFRSDHGANANAQARYHFTPLFYAAYNVHLEAVQVLLEHNADINSQNYSGETPLCGAFAMYNGTEWEGKVAKVVCHLLAHEADPNIRKHSDLSTALHLASSRGWLEVARLLLSYGAKVDGKDGWAKTPFQWAASKGHVEMTKLLLENGAVSEPYFEPYSPSERQLPQPKYSF